MKKLPVTKIKTHRYLYHVAHPIFRKGILKWGLLTHGRENSIIPEGVYAHNLLSKPTYSWYPFLIFGHYDMELGKMYGDEPLRLYDYWRIDTYLIENDWFIDYAMKDEYSILDNGDPGNMYVYTTKDVSIRALTLFRFQNQESLSFKGEKGVFHFRGINEFRPFDLKYCLE
jgi:hypothetical protein